MSKRRCARCDEDQDEAEFAGADVWCRPCRRVYRAQWRARNPGRAAKATRDWLRANPEKAREINRRRDARKKARALVDPEYAERVREKGRLRYRRRAGAAANDDRMPADMRGRRKKVRASVKIELLLEQGYKCAGCSCLLLDGFEVDHRVPLARGGVSERANYQLLCRPCNLAKSDKLVA